MQTFIDIFLGLGAVVASVLAIILVAAWVVSTVADLIPSSTLDRWQR